MEFELSYLSLAYVGDVEVFNRVEVCLRISFAVDGVEFFTGEAETC